MYKIRNSVKAIIIEDNKLLCIKLADKKGNFYILPGGGQEKYETFVETLERECLEELGARVKVGKLKYVREYIARNHEFADEDDNHQVEYMFTCGLLSRPNLENATQLDTKQTGIEWLELSSWEDLRLYPKVLAERLHSNYEETYWGDVN
mgnify:CR=1 FL=1